MYGATPEGPFIKMLASRCYLVISHLADTCITRIRQMVELHFDPLILE
jgi:hypothetical protein